LICHEHKKKNLREENAEVFCFYDLVGGFGFEVGV